LLDTLSSLAAILLTVITARDEVVIDGVLVVVLLVTEVKEFPWLLSKVHRAHRASVVVALWSKCTTISDKVTPKK
jgi:hypothetical protein